MTININKSYDNMMIYIYDGLPKCIFLVLLINRNSLRAASYCAFKTITDLNSLKPCILSVMFEAVAKTAANANAGLYEVGAAASY
jgi:hypothetical protein